jgi:hypothetical protein
MGRPRLEFDLRQVEELGRIQSTLSEVAAVLGCGLSTVKDRLANDPEFAAAFERGVEAGKSSLRRLQWKAAVGGNITMQIWLGKQYLGQRDQQHTELTGARGEPLIPAPLVANLDEPMRALLRQLRARLPRVETEATSALSVLPAPAAASAAEEEGKA